MFLQIVERRLRRVIRHTTHIYVSTTRSHRVVLLLATLQLSIAPTAFGSNVWSEHAVGVRQRGARANAAAANGSAIGSTVELRRVLEVGLAASAAAGAQTPPDITPPVITAVLSPEPNEAGWNNTAVTATFICTDDTPGVIQCPDPVLFDEEGSNQTVSVMATDAAGNHATINVTVYIDKTPVLLTLDSSEAITTGATMEIVAPLTDTLSGIDRARCNGDPATVVDGTARCTIDLYPGVNWAVVTATDRAGNASSASRRIIRTGIPSYLVVTPHDPTLMIGEGRHLTATSEYGLPSADTVWSSSNPSVVEVDADGVIHGLAAGGATVSATSGGLAAETIVTVVAGVVLPSGTRVWTVPPANGFTPGRPLRVNRTGDGDGPDLFAVEKAPDSSLHVLRALRDDGTQLWVATVPGRPLFGDVYGGIVTFVGDPAGGSATGLARFGSETGGPWRYEPTGLLQGYSPAQAPDGTIFLIEGHYSSPYSSSTLSELVALDGATGRVKRRFPLPESTQETHYHSDSMCWNFNERWANPSTGPTIGQDGAAYLEVVEYHQIFDDFCSSTGQNYYGIGTITLSTRLHLIRATGDGSFTSTTIEETSTTYPDTMGNYLSFDGLMSGPLLPDDKNGVSAQWFRIKFDYDGISEVGSFSIGPASVNTTRYVDGTLTTRSLGSFDWFRDYYASPSLAMTGSDGVIFEQTDANLIARNVETWDILWNVESTGRIVTPLAGNGAAVRESTTLKVIDGAGSVNETTELSLDNPSTSLQLGKWEGNDGLTGELTLTVGLELTPSLFYAAAIRDGVSDQRASAPPSDYPTADAAAIAVLKYFNPKSIEMNREFGGSICRRSDGRYVPSVPATDPVYSDTVVPSQCPSGTQRIGKYHTHGNIGNNGHSTPDINNADILGGPSYVGTPCGYIVKYVGPNGHEEMLIARTSTPIKCTP